jgi:hypothetical protein
MFWLVPKSWTGFARCLTTERAGTLTLLVYTECPMLAIEEITTSSSQDTLPVCLWEENPYRLVSCMDMYGKYGYHFWVCCEMLRTAVSNTASIADEMNYRGDAIADRRQNAYEHALGTLDCISQMLFRHFGMPVSVDAAKRIRSRLVDIKASSNSTDVGLLAQQLQSLLQNIGIELDAHKFLYVPPTKQEYYNFDPSPPLVMAVTGHFDEAIADATEAGRCYALGRNTACVFHCMRVLEVGLQAMSKAANLSDPRPNWDPVIRRIDSLLKMDSDHLKRNPMDRVPEIHGHRDFYAGCSAHFHAVKIAWRNRVMHIERSYGDQDAFDIMSSTRGLMGHLAPRLGSSSMP